MERRTKAMILEERIARVPISTAEFLKVRPPQPQPRTKYTICIPALRMPRHTGLYPALFPSRASDAVFDKRVGRGCTLASGARGTRTIVVAGRMCAKAHTNRSKRRSVVYPEGGTGHPHPSPAQPRTHTRVTPLSMTTHWKPAPNSHHNPTTPTITKRRHAHRYSRRPKPTRSALSVECIGRETATGAATRCAHYTRVLNSVTAKSCETSELTHGAGKEAAETQEAAAAKVETGGTAAHGAEVKARVIATDKGEENHPEGNANLTAKERGSNMDANTDNSGTYKPDHAYTRTHMHAHTHGPMMYKHVALEVPEGVQYNGRICYGRYSPLKLQGASASKGDLVRKRHSAACVLQCGAEPPSSEAHTHLPPNQHAVLHAPPIAPSLIFLLSLPEHPRTSGDIAGQRYGSSWWQYDQISCRDSITLPPTASEPRKSSGRGAKASSFKPHLAVGCHPGAMSGPHPHCTVPCAPAQGRPTRKGGSTSTGTGHPTLRGTLIHPAWVREDSMSTRPVPSHNRSLVESRETSRMCATHSLYYAKKFVTSQPEHISVNKTWSISHRAWNRLMHALHGNTMDPPIPHYQPLAICMPERPIHKGHAKTKQTPAGQKKGKAKMCKLHHRHRHQPQQILPKQHHHPPHQQRAGHCKGPPKRKQLY